MNVNRSALIIHDLTAWALPVQVPTDKIPARIRPDGFCRVCGDREHLDPAMLAEYPGERECERYDCELIFTAAKFAECSCCGEVLIGGASCWASVTRDLVSA